jgi:hypothetical protein
MNTGLRLQTELREHVGHVCLDGSARDSEAVGGRV